MVADLDMVAMVQDPIDPTTAKAWVCILKEDGEESHSTRTTLPEEILEVTQATSNQAEDQ